MKVENGGDDGKIQIPIEDGYIDITVSNEPVITAKKKGSYDAANEKLKYEVTVSAEGGTVSGLQIKDSLTDDGDWDFVEYLRESFQVKRGETVLEEGTDYRLFVNEGKETDSYGVDPNSFRIEYLHDLKKGESLTVTYDVKADTKKIIDEKGKLDKTIQNKVTASGTGAKQGEAEEEVNVQKSTVTKSGSLTEVVDEDNITHNVIEWEVEIGDGTGSTVPHASAHMDVEDKLGEGLTLYGDEITLKVYDKNGSKIDNDDYVREYVWEDDILYLTINGEKKEMGEITDSGFKLSLPNQEELEQLFPGKDIDWANCRFKIEYMTEYTEPEEHTDSFDTYKNTVSVGGEVVEGTEYFELGDIIKTVNKDKDKDVLVYTVDVDIPPGNYKDYFYLRDRLRFKDQDYIAENIPNITSLVLTTYDGVEHVYQKYEKGSGEPSGYYYDVVVNPEYTDKTGTHMERFHILFNTTSEDYHKSKLDPSEVPPLTQEESTHIKIVYEIPLNTRIAPEDTNDFSANLTIRDYLSQGYNLNNEVTFYKDGWAHFIEAEADYVDEDAYNSSLLKTGMPLRDENTGTYNGKFSYEVTFKGDGDGLGTIDETKIDDKNAVGNIQFVDTFDTSKLEFDPSQELLVESQEGDVSEEYAYQGFLVEFQEENGSKICAYYGYAKTDAEKKRAKACGIDPNLAGPQETENGFVVNLKDLVILDYPKGKETDDWKDRVYAEGEKHAGERKRHYDTLADALYHRRTYDGSDSIVFHYGLKFKEEYKPADELKSHPNQFVVNLDNTASITGLGETIEDDNTIPYPTGLMTKTVTARAVQQEKGDGAEESENPSVDEDTVGNVFTFTIEVNREGVDLLEGEDVFTLEDRMSNNLSIDVSTFEVIQETPAGSGTWEKVTGWTPELLDGSTSAFKLVGLPDNKHLKITYEAKVYQSGEVTISNEVYMEGQSTAGADVEKKFKVNDSAIGATGSVGKFILSKREKGTEIFLDGAKFKVYIVPDEGNAQPETLKGITAEEGIDLSKEFIVDGARRTCWLIPLNMKTGDETYSNDDFLWETSTQESGSKGQVLIASQFLHDKRQCVLVEEVAPEGYAKLEDPIIITYGESIREGAQLIVDNSPYVELPHTGGTGTIPVTMAGLVMSLGAAYVWYDRRSGEEEEDTDQRDIC